MNVSKTEYQIDGQLMSQYMIGKSFQFLKDPYWLCLSYFWLYYLCKLFWQCSRKPDSPSLSLVLSSYSILIKYS